MELQNVFLKPNVVIEPLVARWYAWSHIISPATAAMNITKRHLEIMNSYVESPDLHMAAVKNPKMLGGPFIDYEVDRAPEIKELIDVTLETQSDLIDLSFAFRKLNGMLKANAKGYSLEELYQQVPEILKGYVELVYDLTNHPSFRVYEYLLYNSKYYKPELQSISLWLTNNDSRPFSLSTPRLKKADVLDVDIAFSSPLIDELSKMKKTARPYQEIRRLLGISDANEPLFSTFFTETRPAAYKKYDGDKIRMRYFGHACILIETREISILVDPLISYYGYHSTVDHFSDYDLPDTIDYVLITHNHQDHILLETLLPLRHRIRNLIIPRSGGGSLQDPSLKLMFGNIGFMNVIEIDEMEALEMYDCTIRGVHFTGEHSDLNIKTKTCYSVKIGDFSLLFMADSRVIDPVLYRHIYRVISDTDVIFLGMECDGAPLTWLYGPLMFEEPGKENDQSRRLSGSDCSKGMQLIDIFNPSEVYVYAMGQEPWCEFISSIKYTEASNPIVQSNQLIEECTRKGIIAERLFGEKEILYSKSKLPESVY